MDHEQEHEMTEQTFQVQGMTCDHCAAAVGAEIAAIPGVTDFRVDLTTGQVTVTSTAVIERVDLAHAIDEAGYELVP
jgi:copper chaperone CopZ